MWWVPPHEAIYHQQSLVPQQSNNAHYQSAHVSPQQQIIPENQEKIVQSGQQQRVVSSS